MALEPDRSLKFRLLVRQRVWRQKEKEPLQTRSSSNLKLRELLTFNQGNGNWKHLRHKPFALHLGSLSLEKLDSKSNSQGLQLCGSDMRITMLDRAGLLFLLRQQRQFPHIYSTFYHHCDIATDFFFSCCSHFHLAFMCPQRTCMERRHPVSAPTRELLSLEVASEWLFPAVRDESWAS